MILSDKFEKTENNLSADDGFYFGIGVFETILVKNGKMCLLKYHLERLMKSLHKLDIKLLCNDAETLVNMCHFHMYKYESENPSEKKCYVLKICVTKENILITTKKYMYKKEDYEKGFSLKVSNVVRNETSFLTNIKSLNYGDNILEKRRAHEEGFDEPLFLNTKGYVAEGAVTNIFGIKDGEIYTPSIECGILPGTVRRFIVDNYKVNEIIEKIDFFKKCDEIFVTNSLIGIMPVYRLENTNFNCNVQTNNINMQYNQFNML